MTAAYDSRPLSVRISNTRIQETKLTECTLEDFRTAQQSSERVWEGSATWAAGADKGQKAKRRGKFHQNGIGWDGLVWDGILCKR